MEIVDYIKSMVPTKHSNKWGEDLPEDIMRLLMGKLILFTDQACFRAVCRRWRQKHYMDSFPSLPKQLPWFFTRVFDDNKVFLRLVDPIYNKAYLIKEDSLMIKKGFHDQTTWASKEGWLLMSHTEDFKRYKIYFYNPFVRKLIQLPDRHSEPNSVTCSFPPTYSDCVVFVMKQNLEDLTVCISTWHLGGDSWTTTVNIRTIPYHRFFRELVYLNDILYTFYVINNVKTGVAAFDLTKMSCSLIPFPDSSFESPEYHYRTYIVESDGELLLVHVPHYRPPSHYECWEIYIFKLVHGLQQMDWIRLGSLENCSLFVSSKVSFSIEVSEVASTIGGIQSDGVYFNSYPWHSRFYSLKNDNRSNASHHLAWKNWHQQLLGYVEAPTTHFC